MTGSESHRLPEERDLYEDTAPVGHPVDLSQSRSFSGAWGATLFPPAGFSHLRRSRVESGLGNPITIPLTTGLCVA